MERSSEMLGGECVLCFLFFGGRVRDGLANGRGRVWWVCESVLVLVRWEVFVIGSRWVVIVEGGLEGG